MKVVDLLESSKPNKLLAVIYPGRFQPFHKGHYSALKQLGEWFNEDNVWIATSDKTTDPNETNDVSFLDFQERKELMVALYHLNPDHIVKCKNPAFSPIEILKLYKAPVVCVMAVGAKDVERYKGSKLFEPYPLRQGKPIPFDEVKDQLSTANEKAKMYYVAIPSGAHGLSGTKCRERLLKTDPNKSDQVKATMNYCFGASNPDIARMLLSNIKGYGEKKEKEKEKTKPKDDKTQDAA